MTTVSVFTPTHDITYLNDARQSMLAQTYSNWEWVIVPNGDFPIKEIADWQADPRIKIVGAQDYSGVGALKHFACRLATGELLVELDHDDWLMPDCLEALVQAYRDEPDAALYYSDFSYITSHGEPSTFQHEGRWNYTREEYYGKTYMRCHAQAPTPENVSVIWYAPNHVRAFSRKMYNLAGGYDPDYAVLDDLDLMTRLYMHGPFVHLDKMLYLQRMHDKNTQTDAFYNQKIQDLTVQMYRDRIEGLTKAWAVRTLKKFM